MSRLWLRGCCVFLAISIVSLMPALLLYYLGYVPINSWNREATATMCQVVDYTMNQHQCSYSCNCRSMCGFKFGCSRACSTCYSTCYDGVIQVTYRVGNATQISSITVEGDQGDPNATLSALTSQYPVGSVIPCYYESTNPSDVRLGFNSDHIYLTFFILCLVVGGVIVLIWLAYELWRYLRSRSQPSHQVTLPDETNSCELISTPDKPTPSQIGIRQP
jgi:hypothetical protein